MRRTVIITGCHRSGTSAVAGMLAAATPIQFGRVNRQYLADNPRGNYENADVVDLNDEICGGWKTPRIADATTPVGSHGGSWGDWIESLVDR